MENTKNICKISVPYVSIWDSGIEIETTAAVDIRTGEVTDIMSADVNGLDICERQYIIMSSEQVDVYENERGYEYWADIKNEIFGIENNIIIVTTKCVNGSLQEGDLVISTPDDEYACLIGRVTKINLLGTPEHNAETENETDDIHVNFLEFDYPKNRIKEIEKKFCGLYSEKKDFDNCGFDDIIMAPCCLIKITDIDENELNYLLQSGYNAVCYCYGILSGLTDNNVLESTQINAEDNKENQEPVEKRCVCGNNQFKANQVCYHRVIVDSGNYFLEDIEIGESGKPYGLYECTECGAEYEELDML